VNADPALVHEPGIEQAPEAVEHTSNVIPFKAVVSVGVKVNVQVVEAPDAELPKVNLRLVS
jgi:hypothetical protein